MKPPALFMHSYRAGWAQMIEGEAVDIGMTGNRASLEKPEQCTSADWHMPTHADRLDSTLGDQAPNEPGSRL
jgi:hypothetical protein